MANQLPGDEFKDMIPTAPRGGALAQAYQKIAEQEEVIRKLRDTLMLALSVIDGMAHNTTDGGAA